MNFQIIKVFAFLFFILFVNNAAACGNEIPIEVVKTDPWKHKSPGEEYPIDYEIIIPVTFKSWEFKGVNMSIGKNSFQLKHQIYEKDNSKVVVFFSATSEFIKDYKFEAMYLPYKKYYKESKMGMPLCFYAQKIEIM